MRKSNNYFKFLEYVTYGKDHDAIDKGNGVMECKSYVSISDIEYRYNATFGLENDWLTFKNILIGEDTLYVYYLEGENSTLVGVYILDNFKTQKELKETITIACTEFAHDILLEKSEEPEEPEELKAVMEVKQELNARFGKEQYFDTYDLQPNNAIIAKLENINHCLNQNTCCIVSPFVHCYYNYKSDSCIKAHKNFIHDCEQVHKQMKARSNPEWHHVNLETLRNIDMLDEKRQCYMYVYRLLKDFRKYAFEISKREVYFDLVGKVIKDIQQGYFNNKISIKAYNYACRHIESVSVEKNYFTSNSEQAFGYKESRRYKITLR